MANAVYKKVKVKGVAMEGILSEELMRFIESVQMTDVNMDIVHRLKGEELKEIARKVHLAKVHAEIFFRIGTSSGSEVPEILDLTFFEEQIDEEYHIDMDYDRFDSSKGCIYLYPWKGHICSEEELRNIKAIVKLITLLVSRSSMNEFIVHAGTTDMLTGLMNNPGLRSQCFRLEKEGELSNYTAIMLNLKNYKYINKRYGTLMGDELLRQYARRLARLVQEGEYASRFGGDNFFLLVKRGRDDEVLYELFHMEFEVDKEALQKAGKADLQFLQGKDSEKVLIQARIGIYVVTEEDTAPAVLENAGIALQTCRRNNQDVAICTPQIVSRVMHGKKMVSLFPGAMKAGEIVPFYQPKVNIATGEIHGCEALVRWFRHGEMMPPGVFLAALEAEGLVRQLDLYMLEAVCRDLRKWLDEGLSPVPVSVNYSRLDLQNTELVKHTKEILDKYRIESEYIEIEITETADAEDIIGLEQFMKEMHEIGIRISMDDFGTGYSSMNVFRKLDFDVVKLDKSFIDNIETSVQKDELIMQNMIRMLGELNVEVVAEGVETKRQIEFLKLTTCRVVQGYYFDKPLSGEEFKKRLTENNYQV